MPSLILALGLLVSTSQMTPVYQLRTYYTAPGKLPVLLERFEKTNLPLFQKHGIELVGAWTPAPGDTAGDRLVYLVRFPDKPTGEARFKAFLDDPEWKQPYAAEKEKHGTVVSKAEIVYLAPTGFSPAPEALSGITPDTLHELRIYHASPGKLENLLNRFRDHTLKFFESHGMTNIVYTVPIAGEPGAGETLIYLLAHKSREAADASWKAFRADPNWLAVRAASQPDDIPLAARVESYFLQPTSFCPGR